MLTKHAAGHAAPLTPLPLPIPILALPLISHLPPLAADAQPSGGPSADPGAWGG